MPRTRFAVVCSFFVALLGAEVTTSARPAAAQLSPSDSAAVLLRTAEQFEREGRWDVAEAIYTLIVERYGSTPAAEDARARLEAPASGRIERQSRVELPVFATLYGLWLGVAVPVAFGAEDPEAYGAGLLLGGPLGLFASRAYQRANPLSEGQARAISWGGIWGTWQGGGWAGVLDLGVEEVCVPGGGCFEGDTADEEVFASMVVGGLAGIVTGAVIARNPVRSGVSSAAQGGSTWGSIYGAMLAEMFDPEGDDAVLATSLLAGNLGLLAGVALGRKYDLSRPRVRIINLGALVGGLGGLGIDLLLQPDSEDVALGIPLTTSLVGLILAAYHTRNDVREVATPSELGPASLVDLRDGRWSLNAPTPLPALLLGEDPTGRRIWRPGVSLELFRARF